MPADTAKRAARSKKEREALQPKPGRTWILPWGYIVFPHETGMSREWVRGPVVGVINPDLHPLKASKVRRFAVLARTFRRWTTPTIAAIAVCGIWGVIQFPGFYTLAALACALTVVYVVPCYIPLPSSRHVPPQRSLSRS